MWITRSQAVILELYGFLAHLRMFREITEYARALHELYMSFTRYIEITRKCAKKTLFLQLFVVLKNLLIHLGDDIRPDFLAIRVPC